ncbi:hypothetical protein [Actinokineospora iranica]|uniref:Uncharacterized protein n=1 Tax=Actinokineospora iranica TaxID=1271860 RepID=A0A1G6QIB9_9PSEU|nr:hypothetical protein [Actinokineospora iranica]SDC91395.1 hypothetical protein SAMN05216174_105277 [Actinokineospora iranica]
MINTRRVIRALSQTVSSFKGGAAIYGVALVAAWYVSDWYGMGVIAWYGMG